MAGLCALLAGYCVSIAIILPPKLGFALMAGGLSPLFAKALSYYCKEKNF